ncbi:MAG: carbon-nitrogen hydrolase family protein [Thermoplasmataceae archaeon]
MRIASVQAPRCGKSSAAGYAASLAHELEILEPDLVVLPEKWVTDHFDQNSAELWDILGVFMDMSASSGSSIVPGSFSIVRDNKMYNSSPFIRSGQLQGFQDKISPYRNERSLYEPGTNISIFDAGPIRISIAVCYDLDFPYYAKVAVARGARMLVNPSLILKEFHEMWHIYVRCRSLENRIPIVSVNSLSVPFEGGSLVTWMKYTDAGVLLKDSGPSRTSISISEIDEGSVEGPLVSRFNEDPGEYRISRR